MTAPIALNINMSAFCHHINNDTPLFVDGYELPHYDKICHVDVDLAAINPYWLDVLKTKNLYAYRAELFYYPAGIEHHMPIHVDNQNGDRAKINWVFGGAGSVMKWYKPLSKVPKQHLTGAAPGSSYKLYDVDEVELIYTSEVANPSIVQVGIPHNIYTPGAERWTYCLVVFDPETKTNASFRKIKQIFTEN